MNGNVSWILELQVRDGAESDLRALMGEMVSVTQATEPGALHYEWSLSADGKVCHIHERYADSAAVLAHLGTFGKQFARRFLAVLTPTRCVVHGSPGPEARTALAPMRPIYMERAAGFTR